MSPQVSCDRGGGRSGQEEVKVTLKQDARLLAWKLEEGAMSQEAPGTEYWELEMEGEETPSRASAGSMAEPTRGTQPSDTDFRVLKTGAVRE